MIAFTRIGRLSWVMRGIPFACTKRTRVAFISPVITSFGITTIHVEGFSDGPQFAIDANEFMYISKDGQFKMYNVVAFTGGTEDDGTGPGTLVEFAGQAGSQWYCDIEATD